MKQQNRFKETEIGLIPEDWIVSQIQEVASKLGDGLHGTPKYDDGGDYYFINGNNLSNGRIEFNDKTKKCEESEFDKYKKEVGNRTLMVSINGTLGNIASYREEKVILSKSICYFNVKDTYDLQFIRYVLANKKFQKFLQVNATGTTIKNFSLKQMREYKFGIPSSLKEQRRISKVAFNLDSQIQTLQNQNKTLEAIGNLIFKQWFVDLEFPDEQGKPYRSSGGEMIGSEFGKIPEGWKVSEIGEELETMLGGTPARAKKGFWTGGTIGWINSGAINEFPIIKPSEMITEEAIKKSATKLMPIKTVVLPFVISLDKEIKISILGFSTCGNQSVIGIIENKKIPAEYIYYWVSYMKQDIYSWATGGAQQHINQKVVVYTPILIPDDQTINKYRTILRPVFDKIINNAHEILSLEQIRGGLLPKMMSGKIRVEV